MTRSYTTITTTTTTTASGYAWKDIKAEPDIEDYDEPIYTDVKDVVPNEGEDRNEDPLDAYITNIEEEEDISINDIFTENK